MSFFGIEPTTPISAEAQAELSELEQAMETSGLKMYSLSPRLIDERQEHNQVVLDLLQKSLYDAHVTPQCREFLSDVVRVALSFGRAPELSLPLDFCGMHQEEGRYGIFDPNADLQGIERKLLNFHEMSTEGLFSPELRRQNMELSTRWREAYRQKYGTDVPTPSK